MGLPYLSDKKDPKSPATTSSAYDCMVPFWEMASTLLAGTEAMRAAGETYLPRHEYESQPNYDERLQTTTLFNAYELTVEQLVGRPFSDPIQFSSDFHVGLKQLMDDIDAMGTPVTTFARGWFREGLAKGFAHVLIDMPALSAEERANRSRADDLAEGRRPFWNLVRPENLIFAAQDERTRQLSHVRIAECVTVLDGYAEVTKHRIRVLEPGMYEVFELQQNPKTRRWTWVRIEAGESGLKYIPLVTFYSNEPESFMMAKPPLQDLAHLNVTHWQSSSDQRNILTVSRFPLLAASGVTEVMAKKSGVPIGPRQFLATSAPEGRFYYVMHDGKSTETGRQDLRDLEEQMRAYGAAMLTQKSGNVKATAKALDSAESTSQLEDTASRFNGALNLAMRITADWLSIPADEEIGKANILTDFGPEAATNIDFQTLNFARAGGPGWTGISLQTYLEELKRRGTFGDEFTYEREIQRIKEEIAKGIIPDPQEMLEMAASPGAGGSPNRGSSPTRGSQQSDAGKDDAASGSTNSQRGMMKAQGSAKSKGAR